MNLKIKKDRISIAINFRKFLTQYTNFISRILVLVLLMELSAKSSSQCWNVSAFDFVLMTLLED